MHLKLYTCFASLGLWEAWGIIDQFILPGFYIIICIGLGQKVLFGGGGEEGLFK